MRPLAKRHEMISQRWKTWVGMAAAVLLVTAQAHSADTSTKKVSAEQFLKNANAELLEVSNKTNRAAWVQATYITEDTQLLAADATSEALEVTTRLVDESK